MVFFCNRQLQNADAEKCVLRVYLKPRSNNQTKSKRNARKKANFKPQTNPMALLKATIKRNKTESKRNARNKAKLKPQTHTTASFKVNTND